MTTRSDTRTLADLERQMAQANNYDEWKKAAIEYDEFSGNKAWKERDQSAKYDHTDIQHRLNEMRQLRATGDDIGLLFALNEGVHGNMGGIGRAELHAVAKFGTKRLIGDYIDEMTVCLKHIASLPENEIAWEEKLDFFERAGHCFGRSALMLSGAGSLLHFHTGVIKTLHEQKLLPTVISGSSGGSVLAGVLGTHTDDQLDHFFASGGMADISNRDFTDTDWRFRRPQIEGDDVYRILNQVIPDLTFQEGFEKTGRMINITVAPVEEYQASRLMNATTSPNVFIRSAILASCAVPGVFRPVNLMAKNVYGEPQAYLPNKRWVDGAITDDLPAKRLARLYGVNHYIVSQANPLSLMLLKSDELWPGPKGIKDVWRHAGREWLRLSEQFSRRYMRYWPDVSKALHIFHSIYAQEYTGDINITPSFSFVDPQKILGHLKRDEIDELCDDGQRSTWPHVEQIRLATQIGHTLEMILDHHADHDVRKRYKSRVNSERSSGTE